MDGVGCVVANFAKSETADSVCLVGVKQIGHGFDSIRHGLIITCISE
jgi:hypothetical protein